MAVLWIVFLGSATTAIVFFVESLLRAGSLVNVSPAGGTHDVATPNPEERGRGFPGRPAELPEAPRHMEMSGM
jgi:hypothetical protein